MFFFSRAQRTKKRLFTISQTFLYFSLYRQREVIKRELVARFESEQITILKNCAAGLASLKQVNVASQQIDN